MSHEYPQQIVGPYFWIFAAVPLAIAALGVLGYCVVWWAERKGRK